MASPPLQGLLPLLPRARSLAGVALIALGTSGCLTRAADITGSIGSRTPTTEEGWRKDADAWGKRFGANPGDPTAAVNYARALRATDQTAQAAAVLEQAALRNPKNAALAAAYGKALAETGRLQEAAEVLSRAHTPERPDWRILSALGAVADQTGDHASAQNYYTAALKIEPEEPAVLSNLGLSYALSKRLGEADEVLRRAVANPKSDARVRQNFALVLGLEGKFAEAEEVLRRDLSPADAATNLATIKTMVAQQNSWKAIRGADARAPKFDLRT